MTDRAPLKYTGDSIPRIGLGTWKSAPDTVGPVVKAAIRSGYRMIDCAAVYGNEAEVGAAIQELMKEGVVTRGQLFITSKLWNDKHAPADVEPTCRQTLKDLQLDYLDLYLIHWPFCYGVRESRSSAPDIPLEDTWKAMEELVRKGLVRNIGFSNFTPKQLERICKIATIPPAVLQCEMHPLCQQKELREICRQKRMVLTASSPLGCNDNYCRGSYPVLMEIPEIVKIAEKHGKTPAQVILRWAYQEGAAIIPKTVTVSRLRENLSVGTEFALDEEDMETIRKLDTKKHICGSVYWDGMTEEEFWSHD